MLYQIHFSNYFPNKEIAGKYFEVFRMSWAKDHWVRDDDGGEVWGYDNPIRGECVRLSALGKGEKPDLSKRTIGYEVFEIDPEAVAARDYKTLDELLEEVGLKEDEVNLLGPGDEEIE